MIYKEFQGEQLSALGFGAMRLPTVDGDNGKIDEAATAEMVAYAMEHGVNYYDTAWGYHNGQSELVMGRILAQYPRDTFYLASKFPGYDSANWDKVESIFEKQLQKCGVEYFDFYLVHNVCEMNIDAYLDPKYRICDYLIEQKKQGRIRHLGFSVHGSYEVMERFLAGYGKDMEFCQIQLNYLDWSFQAANAKVKRLNELGIPIWVMEPVRGGSLATLAEEYFAHLEHARPGISAVEWAFRFLQTIKGVGVTLSGMSDLEQLRQNIAIYESEKPLSDAEWNLLQSVAARMLGKNTLPCTACRYCTEHCPKGLDIPTLLALYNEHRYSDGGFLAPMALDAMPEEKRPAACIGCRSCEAVCPQRLRIADAMADFTERLK